MKQEERRSRSYEYIIRSAQQAFGNYGYAGASESVISVCFNSSLQKYGGDIAVGAMTILTSVMQFAMLPLQGLGQGAQPIISYCYGAGEGVKFSVSMGKILL